MKRSFLYLILFVASFSGLRAMEVTHAQAPSSTSVFDRVPKSVAGYLYGIPHYFSLKQQFHTYGIADSDGHSFKHLDTTIHKEIVDLFEEEYFDCRSVQFMPLNPDAAKNTPGFVITHKVVFIDETWWRTIGVNSEHTVQDIRDIKRFFVAIMIEQLKKGHYRKQLVTKMVVDGVLISMVIGVATYTLAPSVCSWVANTVPGTEWLGMLPDAVSTTVQNTCDTFYAPEVCVMAGKTAWSSLLSPSVGPCVHALLTEPVAQYLAQQSCNKALESIVNRQALADYCTRMKSQGRPSAYFNELETMIDNASSACQDY